MSANKILLYSINFSPELTGIGKYNGEMVEWLTRQGYEVRVITAPPYYPQWQVLEGYSALRYTREQVQGATVWRCPTWVPRKVSGLKRLLHLASFATSSLPVLFLQLFWRPQLCIVIEPPLFISPASVLLSKLFRVKTWLHVQDFEVDAAFELGILPDKRMIKSVVSGVEKWLMKQFDVVSSISRPMTNRLFKKGIPESKVRLFPNWVDLSSVYPLPEKVVSYREKLGIAQEDFIVLYSGNMGEKQGLDILLDAADRLRDIERIHFVLCGDGAVKSKLMREAEERKLSRVRFLPLQPMESLNELLNTADVHALIQKGSASDLVMPSKLTGMLASGKPIIATAGEHSAVYTVMKDSKAGLIVPPEDAEHLTQAILRLSEYPEACALFGSKARQYAVEHLSLDSIMNEFQGSFMELFPKSEAETDDGYGRHEREMEAQVNSKA